MTRSRTPLGAPAVAPPPSRPLGTSGLRTTLEFLPQHPGGAPPDWPWACHIWPLSQGPCMSPRHTGPSCLGRGADPSQRPSSGTGRVSCKPREASPLPAPDAAAGEVGVPVTASAGHPRGPPRPPLFLLTAHCPLVPSSRTLTTHLPHQAPFRAPIAQALSPGVHPRGHSARVVPG